MEPTKRPKPKYVVPDGDPDFPTHDEISLDGINVIDKAWLPYTGFAPEGISEDDGNTGDYEYAWQRMESPGIKRGEMERRFYREIKTVAMGDTDNPDTEDVNPGRQPYGSSKMQGLSSTQITDIHKVNFSAIWLENFATNGEYVREIIDQDTKVEVRAW